MSNNAGSCKIIEFVAVDEIPDDLSAWAEDFFEVVSTDYGDDGKEKLTGYMRTEDSIENMKVSAEACGVILPAYQCGVLSSDDWLTENVIKFAPVEEAEFYVYGIHEKNVDTHGKIGIKVYAATAFGSEHQTTKCCLQGISEINRLAGVQKKVLDVGTGSGILALACAKLWPQALVTAVDIDDEAVRVTQQNVADNQVESQITAALSDGYHSELVRKNAPYDVILANILARPLLEMAPDMANNLKKGGYAVISGFIEEQVDWVVGEHQKYGLKPVKVYQMDNWRAVLLEKE